MNYFKLQYFTVYNVYFCYLKNPIKIVVNAIEWNIKFTFFSTFKEEFGHKIQWHIWMGIKLPPKKVIHNWYNKYIEDMYFFEVNIKYISSSMLKT